MDFFGIESLHWDRETREQRQRRYWLIHSIEQRQTLPYYGLNEKGLNDWISSMTAPTALNADHTTGTTEPFDFDSDSQSCLLEYNADCNINPSLSSSQDAETSQTRRAIEEDRAQRLSRQISYLPQTVFEQYRLRYPLYAGNHRQFIETCTFLKSVLGTSFQLHPFLWDDFLRFVAEANKAAPPAILNMPPHARHRCFFINYHRMVDAPQYVGNVLNKRTLYDLVDSDIADQIRLEMHLAEQRWRETQCNRTLDIMLQRAIAEDVEGIDGVES